ncbi:MAG: hypothetical protein ABIQ16_03655 [Polyangiaceae bacterium]
MRSRWLSVFVRCALAAGTLQACAGTAGDHTVDFEAAASGPADAVSGQPLVFEGARGWEITLESAHLHIGGVYLADSRPVSGVQAASCTLPGSYVAQVTQGRDVDLLSGEPQRFPGLGRGITVEALAGQLWLTSGDVNDVNDPPQPTVILELSGSAQQRDEVRAFGARLTIASNRVTIGSEPAGADPICRQRIVSPIPTSIRIASQGALWLRVDPRRLFTNVDFGALSPDTAFGDHFSFRDDSNDQPSANLYDNLKTGKGGDLYTFSWVPSLQ